MIINMNGAKAPETPSSVLQEKTVTPETLPTVIGPDEGYDGLTQVTVNPDPQLKPENIRSGKSIFGVAGAFVGEPAHTNSIFEILDDATINPLSYGLTRPTVLSKNMAVFGDVLTNLSGYGRLEYQMIVGYMASDRSLGIGYAYKGNTKYTYNYPAVVESLESKSLNLTDNELFSGRSKCKIGYTVFPAVFPNDYAVGSTFFPSTNMNYSIMSECFHFTEEVDIVGNKITINIPTLAETTCYYTYPNNTAPTSTYYCYWIVMITTVECM